MTQRITTRLLPTRAVTAGAGGARLDKWLWAARFFKTRGLAHQAVEAGRVRRNGERVKPGHAVKPGDELSIQVGDLAWQVRVQALSERRGPAAEARRLYVEDAASREARERRIEERKRQSDPAAALHGRPTKRDRRLIHRFNLEKAVELAKSTATPTSTRVPSPLSPLPEGEG